MKKEKFVLSTEIKFRPLIWMHSFVNTNIISWHNHFSGKTSNGNLQWKWGNKLKLFITLPYEQE